MSTLKINIMETLSQTELWSPMWIGLIVSTILLVILLLWIHKAYVQERSVNHSGYMTPKMKKKIHREFLKKIGAEIK